MIVRNASGQRISSVDEWLKYAPPKKGAFQWKDYRSAKELAKAWITSDVAAELRALFESQPDFRDLTVEEVIPEYTIRLDNLGGEPRNADLLLAGHCLAGPVVATIEAKADEEFGPLIGKYAAQKTGTRSKVPERIDGLLSAVFGKGLDEQLGGLRYQLLHAVAGTLIEAKAREAIMAAFIVHEFRSVHLNARKVAANGDDWARFMGLLAQQSGVELSADGLSGPFKVVGGGLVPNDIPLYVGKIVTDLPRSCA
jgi:hypothetical protein